MCSFDLPRSPNARALDDCSRCRHLCYLYTSHSRDTRDFYAEESLALPHIHARTHTHTHTHSYRERKLGTNAPKWLSHERGGNLRFCACTHRSRRSWASERKNEPWHTYTRLRSSEANGEIIAAASRPKKTEGARVSFLPIHTPARSYAKIAPRAFCADRCLSSSSSCTLIYIPARTRAAIDS